MEVKLTLTAGMLIDQLPKQEQARVARAVDKLRTSSSWDGVPAEPIRQLPGGASRQRTFLYPVGDLRIIFDVVGNTIHVLDVAHREQIKSLRPAKR